MNAQADNRGLEMSISGLFLRIIVYEYLYDSIYCLANSFLTKKVFVVSLMLIKHKFYTGPHQQLGTLSTEKYFSQKK